MVETENRGADGHGPLPRASTVYRADNPEEVFLIETFP